MQKASGALSSNYSCRARASCLIKISVGPEKHVVLMDAAVTPACLFNNAEVLKADLGKIEASALSHGHPDHFLGLVGLLKSLN